MSVELVVTEESKQPLFQAKGMRVKELAVTFGCTEETVKNHIRHLWPTKMKNGVATILTEVEASALLAHIKQPVSSGPLANLQNEIVGNDVTNKITEFLEIELLQQQIDSKKSAYISRLQEEVAQLQQELDASKTWSTLKKYSAVHGLGYSGAQLSEISKKLGAAGYTHVKRYGIVITRKEYGAIK